MILIEKKILYKIDLIAKQNITATSNIKSEIH